MDHDDARPALTPHATGRPRQLNAVLINIPRASIHPIQKHGRLSMLWPGMLLSNMLVIWNMCYMAVVLETTPRPAGVYDEMWPACRRCSVAPSIC